MAMRIRPRLLAAASFLTLMLAVVPGIAYTGSWAVPEGEVRVIVAEEPTAGHDGRSHHHDGHSHHHHGDAHGSDVQKCRVGPTKCTSQPSFVATTWAGGGVWTPAPPAQTLEVAGAGAEPGVQPPVYRQKPPPREIQPSTAHRA